MLCDKCQMLKTGGEKAPPHSDLAHVRTRTNVQSARIALASVESYQCKSCGTRWEVDFQPPPGGGNGSFRQMG